MRSLAVLVLTACTTPSPTAEPTPDPTEDPTPTELPTDTAPPPAQTVVTLVELNDFHANLVGHPDLVRDPDGTFHIEERGGAARTATVISEIRTQNPDAIVLNIGDTYHGGVEAMYTDGDAIHDVVEALGIDLGVPGNWDFAYGPPVSWKRFRGDDLPSMFAAQAADIRTVGYTPIAANAFIDADNTGSLTGPMANMLSNALRPDDGEPWIAPTAIRTVDGIDIGFIGLTSDFVARMHPMMALGLAFTDGEDATRQLVEDQARTLRTQGADLVVVASELSVHKDHRLGEVLEPGLVDVFLSAHTHELTLEPLVTASGAIVVEAGNDGWIGQLDLVVEDGALVDTVWTLHPIDASVAADPTVAALVEQARAPFLGDVSVTIEEGFMPNPLAGQPLTRSIDTVIGTTDRLLHRRDALESPFNDAFTDMYVDYTHAHAHIEDADVAISPGFRYEIPLAPAGWDMGNGIVATGDITLEQAYRYFPAPYTLGIGHGTLGQLHAVQESLLTNVFSPDVWKQEGGWVDGFSGVSADVDLTGPDGARVSALSLTDGTTDPSTPVVVAGCRRPMDDDSTLCSHGGFSQVVDLTDPVTGRQLTALDVLEWGLAQGVPAPRQSLTEVSAEPMWPEATFVQPLEGVVPQ